MSVEIKSFLSLRFFLKRFEFPFNFFAKVYNFIFTRGVNASIEYSSLPEPKIIDHVTQNNYFMIIVFWWFELRDVNIRPLYNKIDNFSWCHFEISLRSGVYYSLLQNGIIDSSLTKLVDWFHCIYWYLYLLGCSFLIVVIWYNLFSFLKFMELEFLFLVWGFLFC